jgi:hypothetical protein
MQRVLLPIVLIFFAACAATPERPIASDAKPASADEVCAVAQCGYDIRVELKREDGSLFAETFDAMPIVQEAGVSVYAGSTVFFEAEEVKGELVNLRLVAEVVNPERTISAKLEQDDKGGMMLITKNPFDKHLRIRMGIMPLELDRLVRTSSCPVVARGASYELWPYPIFQVFLGEMRLMSESEPMACIE